MTIQMGDLELLVRDSGFDQVFRNLAQLETKAAKLGAKPLTVSLAAPNTAVVTRTLASLGDAGEKAGAEVARGMEAAAAATQQATKTLSEQQRVWEAEARRGTAQRSGPMLGPGLPGMTTQIAAQASTAAQASMDQAAAKAESLSATIARLTGNLATMGKELDVTSAKAVVDFKASADATTQYALGLGATDAQLDAIGTTITDVERRQTAAAQATSRATSTAASGVTVFGQQLTRTSGALSAFSMRGLGAMNAMGFGLSQLAATGTTSFRSIATAATGFLAFLGPGGAIASGVISTGLILTDFWSRQRKEIEETKKLVDQLVDAGKQRDMVSVIDDQQKQVRRQIDANRQAMADAFDVAKRTVQLKEGTFVRPVDEKRVAELSAERFKLEQAETQLLRQLGDERAKQGKLTEDLEEKRLQRIAQQVANHQTLAELGKATSEDMRQAALLERQLRAELKRTNETDLERRVTLLQQIAVLSGLAIRPLATPAVGLTPSRERAGPLLPGELATPGRGGSATSLPLPNIPPVTAAEKRAARERMQGAFDASEMQLLEDHIADSVAGVIAGGLGRGLAEGIARGWDEGGARGALKEGFKGLAADMLSGLGGVFLEIGQKALAGMKLLATISKWMVANPWIGIPAAIALIALGSSMGGRGGGGGGGSGGSSFTAPHRDIVEHIWLDPDRHLITGPTDRPSASQPRMPTPSDLTPTKPMVNQFNFTIIGENDPRAQAQIVSMVNRGLRAGHRLDT